MPTIHASLPVLYRELLPGFFGSEVPDETKATCHACAMVSGGSAQVDAVDGVNRLFRPETKCCTYQPRLPNYLLGALLSDTSEELAEGRRRLREKLQKRVGVTPQWVKPSARWSLLYDAATRAFGKATSLRCPYYEANGGGCTIWPYREAVCSTYFCKYVSGQDGRTFWMTLKSYLALVEIQLSRWALLRLLPEYVLQNKDKQTQPTSMLSPEDLDESGPNEKLYANLWGAWAGREEELYRASYDAVRTLSQADLDGLLGLDGVIHLQILEKSFQPLAAPQLPRLVKLNTSATVKWLPDGSVALGAYSDHDALALPGEAYQLLTAFDGRLPVDEVRERLRTERLADLSEEVLLVLYQQRILTEAT